ncbi:PD-(D/E)XK nuclease family protein [Falsiroseomonas tokyonensis]|uniref:PD-(D/E)XK nuclease family protein n=1 Tax=Falsiroseomonas tokyonensis TaxID=430521 RepID=A0ABV7BXH6_9PROT|nr:PD-(D/E)XK nuclease family protein [Falsiroseomonas tokyonensis]MBU8540223.1 PD-(D/E)XK nuclease family protein [Falsiroseomonas tokyonensis]
MTKDIVVRPSSLTTFASCPRRWAARHMQDEVRAAGYTLAQGRATHVGAQIGTAVHAAASHTLAEKMRRGGDLGTDADAEEVGIEAFRERVAAEGCDWDTITGDPDTAQKQIRRMSRVWRRSEAAAGNPLMTEERLEAEVRPGLIASGQMDAVMTGDPDASIRDTKTGVSRRANALQYGTYGMILRAHGHNPGEMIEDYLPRVSIRKEQPPVEAHSVDIIAAQEEAWEAIEALAATVEEFRRRCADPNSRPPNMAFRANPADSLCAARWCPAWGTDFCRAHIQAPRSADEKP